MQKRFIKAQLCDTLLQKVKILMLLLLNYLQFWYSIINWYCCKNIVRMLLCKVQRLHCKLQGHLLMMLIINSVILQLYVLLYMPIKFINLFNQMNGHMLYKQ